MANRPKPLVIHASALTELEPIDAGHTVAVRFETAEGQEVALFIRREIAAALVARLSLAINPMPSFEKIGYSGEPWPGCLS